MSKKPSPKAQFADALLVLAKSIDRLATATERAAPTRIVVGGGGGSGAGGTAGSSIVRNIGPSGGSGGAGAAKEIPA